MKKLTVHLEISSRPRSDGRHIVLLRISQGRDQCRRISTAVYIFKKDFNSEAKYGQWIRLTDSLGFQKNEILKSWISKAESAIYSLEKQKTPVTQHSVIQYIKGEEKETSFLKYAQKVTQQHYESQRVNLYKRYNGLVKKLNTYTKEKNLEFQDINVEWLNAYQTHFLQKGISLNTISKEQDTIRTILYRAAREDIYQMTDNPFFKYKLKYNKVLRAKLTIEEIHSIENLLLPEGSLIFNVRNYFLFSFFCAGIRFGDMCRLTWQNIQNDKLIYTMNKTTSTRAFVLHQPIQRILNCYKKEDSKPDDFIFPILPQEAKEYDIYRFYQVISAKNALVNKKLKQIAKLAGIDSIKNLSFHLSRHAFASICASNNVPIFQIQKALAHSNAKITQIYCDSLNNDAADFAVKTIVNL